MFNLELISPHLHKSERPGVNSDQNARSISHVDRADEHDFGLDPLTLCDFTHSPHARERPHLSESLLYRRSFESDWRFTLLNLLANRASVRRGSYYSTGGLFTLTRPRLF